LIPALWTSFLSATIENLALEYPADALPMQKAQKLSNGAALFQECALDAFNT
jgi:hypothetical protein